MARSNRLSLALGKTQKIVRMLSVITSLEILVAEPAESDNNLDSGTFDADIKAVHATLNIEDCIFLRLSITN